MREDDPGKKSFIDWVKSKRGEVVENPLLGDARLGQDGCLEVYDGSQWTRWEEQPIFNMEIE